jgi:Skp family chaperone for outer membrane proteins
LPPESENNNRDIIELGLMMETMENEFISQDTGPILQLKRPLMPIDQYAAREGVSPGILEQCGKLGIVQIRKYKGQTYVVDVPISPNMPELVGDPAKPIDKAERARRIAELIKKTFPVEPPVAPLKPKIAPDNTEKASKLYRDAVDIFSSPSPAVQKSVKPLTKTTQLVPPDSLKIADEPDVSLEDIDWEEILNDMQSPKPQSLNVIEEPIELFDETIEIQPRLRQPQVTRPANKVQQQSIFAKLKAGFTWRVAAVFFLACLFIGVTTVIGLYQDRQVQFDKFQRANATVRQFVNSSTQANKQAKELQDELNSSVTQLQQLKATLENSKAELKTAQDELTTSRQNLENIRRNNTEALQRLNERIQKLAERMPKSTSN